MRFSEMERGRPARPKKTESGRLARVTAALLILATLPAPLPAEEIPLFTEEGFRVPQPGTVLEFPRAHASHPAYKIEWWYLTGHLFAEDDRRFGFQATFFRVGARPPDPNDPDPPAPNAPFGDSETHLTHMSLLDVRGDRFLHRERLNRDGHRASASAEILDVRNGDWRLHMVDTGREHMHLRFSLGSEARVELALEPVKPLVIFGEDGTSRKGSAPSARSFYITFTRLAVNGTIELGSEIVPVRGEAWMDHEIASEQLSEDLAGWDWTAIHLHDGREVKAYILRRPDGTPDEFSSLIWIGRDNELTYIGPDGFRWEADRTWRSPRTGAVYPVEPRITTTDPETGETVVFQLRALRDDQEMNTRLGGPTYWEGACVVFDAAGREIGNAYLELVGYADDATASLR